MEITRTTRIKIDLDLDVARRTVQAWTDACNFVSVVAFENGNLSNAARLHGLVYRDVRERFGLSAQVAASCIRQIASKYAALRTKKERPRKPVSFKSNGVMLQGGARGRDFSFTHQGLSVTTIDGRIRPVAYHGEPRLSDYLNNWRIGDARLFIRRGKVYLSVSFKCDAPDIERPNDAVIGVDRGINNLAVVTDGKRARFFGGGHTRHVRNRYSLVRASLQRKKTQTNSRSVRRVLNRLSGREARFTRDANHVISRRIVEFAEATGNPTIAIEHLASIRNGRLRKPQRTDLNRWAFYQLETFTRYKAEGRGFEVVEVEASGTSKGCSRCGYTAAHNRSRHDFTCRACGYSLHADLNAARNIRLRGILSRQALAQEGPSSTGPEARVSSETTGKLLASAGGS
ncbi:MAG: transposase [Ardenticatenaceae bacterium]|nr:transposase [Ardenticatenaceae bacterium]